MRRLIIQSKVIDLSKLIVFVLDEADVMISMQGHQVTSIRLKKLVNQLTYHIIRSTL